MKRISAIVVPGCARSYLHFLLSFFFPQSASLRIFATQLENQAEMCVRVFVGAREKRHFSHERLPAKKYKICQNISFAL